VFLPMYQLIKIVSLNQLITNLRYNKANKEVKMRFFSLGMFFVVGMLLCVVSVEAHAQQPVPQNQQPQYDLTNLKSLPDGSSMSIEAFIEESQEFTQVDEDRPYLNYRVLLPKTWSSSFSNQQDVGRFNPNFLTDLGRYVSPPYGDKRAFLSVQATVLRYESFAEDWLRNQILINGYSVNAISVKSNYEVEALYSAFEGNITFAVRARVIIDGNLLYFVRYALPIEYFSQRADHQKHVMDSFKLLNPTGGSIEKTRRFSLLDVLTFDYPSSWVIKNPELKKLDHLKVDLLRLEQDSIILGRIGMEALEKVPNLDLSSHMQRITGKLEDKGVKIDELKKQIQVVLPQKFAGGAVEVYDTYSPSEEGIEQEFWFSFFESNDYYFFFTMLTPTRDASYEEWSRNRAVFIKILNLLK